MRSLVGTAWACAALAGGAPAAAAPFIQQFDEPRGPLRLELPLFDAPANLEGGYTAPSMQQSLWIQADVYQAAHFGIAKLLGDKSFGALLTISAFDTASLMMSVPFLGGWQHEEWHRAVLSRWRIPSTDPYYTSFGFPLFQPRTIQASQSDLERFQREHPVEYVRGSAAGFEAQFALVRTLEEQAFFHDVPTTSGFLIGMLDATATVYMVICNGNPSGGGDCVAWSDALFFPGTVPASRKKLPAAEAAYLEQQFWLSLVNFADPFIPLFRAFKAGDARFMPSLHHVPTSFGYDVRADLFYRSARGTGLAFSVDNYVNNASWFPGVEAALMPVPIGPIDVSGRANVFAQPDQGSFFTKSPRPGADVSVRVGVPVLARHIQPYAEFEGKTAGWVMGNVFLDANVTGRAGLIANLF